MASRSWRRHTFAQRSRRKRNSNTQRFALAGSITGDEGNTFTEGHTFAEGHTGIEGNARTKAFAGDEARADTGEDKDALMKRSERGHPVRLSAKREHNFRMSISLG